MWNRDHFVQIPVDNLNSLSADSIADFSNLRRTFMMPAGSDGLHDKAHRGESKRICLFVNFLRCEPVAVGRKMTLGVGLVKPFLIEHTSFDIGELRVRGLREAERRRNISDANIEKAIIFRAKILTIDLFFAGGFATSLLSGPASLPSQRATVTQSDQES